MRALEEKGIVDQVMQSLNLSKGNCVKTPSKAQPVVDKTEETHEVAVTGTIIQPNKRYVFLQVLGGKAFLDHLQESESSLQQFFILHVHFRGQRLCSKPIPCSCEPAFHEGFLLELSRGPRDAGRPLSYTDLLSVSDPIHLTLVRNTPMGDHELGRANTSLEMAGASSEGNIPAGILDVRLESLPRSEGDVIGTEVLAAQLSLEKQRAAERERVFLVYAKQWWREYQHMRTSHVDRMVKIFAHDESGVSHPVCAYVHPMRAGRLLDGPRHAARYVSLIPYERASSVGTGGGSRDDVWSSTHALLCQKKGGTEDHATLLCSLLLGFGLDAYVCIGTKVKGLAHAWVMTLGHTGMVTFWEPLTGQRYLHAEFQPNRQAGSPLPIPQHPYSQLGCIFNHQSFYANIQPSDSVAVCRFDLHNSSLWKAMSSDAIKAVTTGSGAPMWRCPPLLASQVDTILIANELETELRVLTAQYRQELGLGTHWDDDLSYLLSPALTAYELERCTGLSVGNEEFQDAIHNVVPVGSHFQGISNTTHILESQEGFQCMYQITSVYRHSQLSR
eukprot:Em0018g339a